MRSDAKLLACGAKLSESQAHDLQRWLEDVGVKRPTQVPVRLRPPAVVQPGPQQGSLADRRKSRVLLGEAGEVADNFYVSYVSAQSDGSGVWSSEEAEAQARQRRVSVELNNAARRKVQDEEDKDKDSDSSLPSSTSSSASSSAPPSPKTGPSKKKQHLLRGRPSRASFQQPWRRARGQRTAAFCDVEVPERRADEAAEKDGNSRRSCRGHAHQARFPHSC